MFLLVVLQFLLRVLGTNCDDNVADEIRYDNGLVHDNETTDNMNIDEEIDVGDQCSDVFYGVGEEIRAVDYSCNGMPGTDHKSELELNEPKSSGYTQTKKRRAHTPLFIQHGRFYDSTQNKKMESHSSGLVRDVAPCNLEPTNSSSGDAVPSNVPDIVELSAHNPPILPVHGDDTSIVSRNAPERDFNHKRIKLESLLVRIKQMKYGAQN